MKRRAPAMDPSPVKTRRKRVYSQRTERNHDLPLLKLPGELRNRIYEYVIEPAQVKLILFPHCGPRKFDWRRSKRTSLGLTQVCREIRAEVLPLHRKAYKISMELWYDSSVQELDAGAFKLCKILDGPVMHNISGWPSPLDVLGLVRQDTEVDIAYGISSGRRDPVRNSASRFVKAMIKASRSPAGALFVNKKVQSMVFTMNGLRPRLAIVVHPHAAKVWMPYTGRIADHPAESAVRSWLGRNGFGATGLNECNFDIA